jgi:hypothetical protein
MSLLPKDVVSPRSDSQFFPDVRREDPTTGKVYLTDGHANHRDGERPTRYQARTCQIERSPSDPLIALKAIYGNADCSLRLSPFAERGYWLLEVAVSLQLPQRPDTSPPAEIPLPTVFNTSRQIAITIAHSYPFARYLSKPLSRAYFGACADWNRLFVSHPGQLKRGGNPASMTRVVSEAARRCRYDEGAMNLLKLFAVSRDFKMEGERVPGKYRFHL